MTAEQAPSTPETTVDWTGALRKNMQNHLHPLIKDMAAIHYLEIGVFEALGATRMLSKYPQMVYVGVDCWNLADAPVVISEQVDIEAVYARAQKNIEPYAGRAKLIKSHSIPALCNLYTDGVTFMPDGEQVQGARFDLIYIDAGHFAFDVVTEAALCWAMLKVGGIMFFDDYKDQGIRNTVKTGADSFLACVKGRYEEIFRNHQLGIRKTAEAQGQTEYRRRKGKTIDAPKTVVESVESGKRDCPYCIPGVDNCTH